MSKTGLAETFLRRWPGFVLVAVFCLGSVCAPALGAVKLDEGFEGSQGNWAFSNNCYNGNLGGTWATRVADDPTGGGHGKVMTCPGGGTYTWAYWQYALDSTVKSAKVTFDVYYTAVGSSRNQCGFNTGSANFATSGTAMLGPYITAAPWNVRFDYYSGGALNQVAGVLNTTAGSPTQVGVWHTYVVEADAVNKKWRYSLDGGTTFSDVACATMVIGNAVAVGRQYSNTTASYYDNVKLELFADPAPGTTLVYPTDGTTNCPITGQDLYWNTVADPTLTYQVRVGTTNPPTTVVATDIAVGAEMFITGGLLPDTTYYWQVGVCNAAGDPTLSEVWSFTTASAGSAPNAPTTPTPEDYVACIKPGNVTFTWVNGGGAVSYDFYIDDGAGGAFTKVGSDLATETFATTVEAGKTYRWRVDAKNAVGTTTGDEWHFTTGVLVTLASVPSNYGACSFVTAPTIWENLPTSGWFPPNTTSIQVLGTPAEDGLFLKWSLSADPAVAGLSTSASYDYAGLGTSAVTLYGHFDRPKYHLSVVADPSGTTTGTGDYVGETAVAITATGPTGYRFVYWESLDEFGAPTGTFADATSSSTTYTTTRKTATVKAYFSKAAWSATANKLWTIYANSADGSDTPGGSSTIRLGAYSINPVTYWARALVGFSTTSVPTTSLIERGIFTASHVYDGSYSSSVTINVSAYPISVPWSYTYVSPSYTVYPTWLCRDYTVATTTCGTPWTTPGGDHGAAIGAAQPFVGVPAAGVLVQKAWRWATPDNHSNGIELISAEEGAITNRKGIQTAGTGSPTMVIGYAPPAGDASAASAVIRTWAYLGFYPRVGTDPAVDDHVERLAYDEVAGTYGVVPVTEMSLAPKTNATYGAASWQVGTSAADLVDLLGPGFYNSAKTEGTTYAAVYVKYSGANNANVWLGVGSDDGYKAIERNAVGTNVRGSSSIGRALGYDQNFNGPFTLSNGWNTLVIKVENGAGLHGLYARLANADRTALGGCTYAVTDNTAPTAPTSAVETGGAVTGVGQTAVTAPVFTLAGAADPETSGEGVSGVRGYKVYFGTNAAGAPDTWAASTTFAPGTQTPGTYYLRVSAVDYALNESAPVTLFTFILDGVVREGNYGITNKAALAAVTAASTATKNFTVWGAVTIIDANSFVVDDGSGAPVKVLMTAHGLSNGDYASATGALDVSGAQPVVTATAVKKQN